MALPGARRRNLLLALTLTLLLIAALVLPPLININRYQRQIAASIAAGIGHPVEISGVRLQVLPLPAVQIADFTVDSNPGFSAEPILQCSSVTAALRLTSLWRGRLEISRIALDEPSVNLERAPDGEWNFASVLLQASRIPQAPTARQIPRAQNRFPYIEATSARINFKYGVEKLPFSFLNADMSVWLETPDEWQLRFAAQPMRTDLNLSLADTGLVRVSGSVHRASTTNQLPLDLRVDWRGAPLGQVTRMLAAQDMGWRGDTSLALRLVGVPDALAVSMTAGANDFHRESFVPARSLNLHVTCTATYQHTAGSLNSLRCLSPVGNGRLDLSGTIEQLHSEAPQPRLKLAAARVPADAALEFLRHTRGHLDNTLTLSGTLEGELKYEQQPIAAQPSGPLARSASARRRKVTAAGHNTIAAAQTVASGSLTGTGLVLRADDLQQPLPDLHITLQPAHPAALVLEPARVDLGAPQPLLAEGQLTRQSFALHLSGAGALAQLLPLAHALHLLPAALQGVQGSGTAECNLTVRGDWLLPLEATQSSSASNTSASNFGQTSAMQNNPDQPAPASLTNGSLTLHNVVFQPAYLAGPVRIASATAQISPAELRWSGIAATLGETRFSGTLHIPLLCQGPCPRTFDLVAPTASIAAVAASLRGEDEGVVAGLISRVRTRSHQWPLLDGTMHVGRLTMGAVEVAGASAGLTLRAGTVQLRSFDGKVLGGTVHARGTVALDGAPTYQMDWQLNQVNAPELSQLLDENWGPGVLDLSGKLSMKGTKPSDLSSSARGVLAWEWTNGALPELTASPMRQFDRWSGTGTVAKGTLSVTNSDVAAEGATAPVTGTIGKDRSLHLKIGTATTLTSAASTLTGTLAAPVIETP
jgi:uncharacterized protein involved in outer membrane biogenesis